MMKNIVTLFFLLSSLFAIAQLPLKQSLDIGVSGAIENNTSNISLSISHHIGIGQKCKFQFYYGLRTNNIFNSSIMYDVNQSSVRMLQNKTTYTSANNLFIGLNCHLIGSFSIGLNSDIIGLSFGSNQNGYYNINADSGVTNYKNFVQTKPFAYNFFLFSNSLGSLNQEYYIEYLSDNKWKVRAGLSYLTTELIVSGGGLSEDKKVQNDFNLFFINVSYPLWRWQ